MGSFCVTRKVYHSFLCVCMHVCVCVGICVDRCVRAVQVKETSSWKRPWPLSINTRWDVGSAGDVD